ncbi:hypothetical protein YpsIP31758_A0017 (plasmid) [Yersinia pseudotuberculosis IP 31758]|uniref:RiboL-PSP-HEPN domain-containing protein n=1 Tax=Yersinia pseudotuberculosis serotype O:1b (strain IP 31758) TaxID=349747 RepID=A0A0U1QTA1_YERP3|nr:MULTISPECIES: hypothetical protein [Yersinia pseudotuberculosis complex]ABS45610.1 hypothetical protein YpsIP31758_A0017 [Yersinia pseudotuberculosis IP 31758]
MSSTKQWFEDEEENRREAWIRARLSDPDLGNDSDEWQELEEEYDNYKDFMEDMAREEYEEQQWLKNNPHTDIYVSSISLLDEILDEGKEHTSETFYKMQIAYCVTIMESCLGDMIKSIVLSDNRYRNYAVYQIEHLRKKEINLVYLIDKEDVVGKSVQEYLTGITYHDIPIVERTYRAILQIKKYKNIDTTKIDVLTTLRNDIVHRNGKTREGNDSIKFDYNAVLEAFDTTKIFLTEMKDMISEAIKYHEEKQMNKDLEN